MRGVLLGILIAVGGMFGLCTLLVIAVGTMAAPENSGTGDTPSSGDVQNPTVRQPTPAPRILAEALWEEMQANPVRFNRERAGNYITVSGEICHILDGGIVLYADVAHRNLGTCPGTVGVLLSDLGEDDLVQLSVGETLEATCIIAEYSSEFPMAVAAFGCRIVDAIAPSVRQPTSTSGDETPPAEQPNSTPSPGAPAVRQPTPGPPPAATPEAGPVSDAAALIQRIKDGIVKVEAGWSSSGSGFIFDVEGMTAFVATNHHVIENQGSIDVIVRDSRTYEALVLGWDADRDVAVLAICCSEDFAVLTWEKASPVPGDDVVAVGYPRGGQRGQVTATTGVIAPDDDLSRRFDYIPHTAPLNPGNSGGPLLSFPEGKLLGINIARGTHVLSFYAVPFQAVEEQLAEWRAQLVVS